MNACLMCERACTGAKYLTCGHIHCQSCISEVTFSGKESGGSYAVCKWKGCDTETSVDLIKQVPIVGTCTDPAYDPSDKPIDPSLQKLHQEQMHAQQEPQHQYEGDDSDEIDEQTDEILRIIDILSDKVKDCRDILGFYESRDGEKVVVDVASGKLEIVRGFLSEHMKEQVDREIFKYIEQATPNRFLLATGAKVACGEIVQGLVNQHPDVLRNGTSFASVSFLGIDSNENYYIITSKHVFPDYMDNQPGGGVFVSTIDSKLQEVSTEAKGYLGGTRIINRFKHLIDVAALKLKPEIKSELDRSYPLLMHDLNRIYREDRIKRRNELAGRVVYKHGATTGTTCGVILRSDYNGCITDNFTNERVAGMCFMVRCYDPNGENAPSFAENGDSGALVWDENGRPIGIVSYVNSDFRTEDAAENAPPIRATVCVRLDYCIQVLHHMRNIRITNLRVLGYPLPVTPAPPNNMLAGNRIEQVAV